MPGSIPQWLLYVFGLVGVYVLFHVAVRIIREVRRTIVMAAAHNELPTLIGQVLAIYAVGVVAYLYFFAPRSRDGVTISANDILAGVGATSVLVGAFLKSKQRSWEATDILAAADFLNDARCATCGCAVDGTRVSHDEYQRLWEDEDEQYRIRGHVCESCNAVSCFGCREAAVAWVDSADASQWETALKAICTTCRTRRSLKLIVEPASLHAEESPNRVLKL